MTSALCCGQLPLLLALFACSLDDRVLQPEKRPSSDRDDARDDTDADDDRSSSDGGEGAASELVGGCADLDTDGVADCKSTLVTTPSFTSDVEGWMAIDGATLSWDEKNALSDEPSGSAKLSGEAAMVRATQCVPLPERKLIIAYANAFVETDESGEESEGARALLEISFFAADDCSGESVGLFETPPSTVTNAWTTVQAGGVSTDSTKSISVTLMGIRAAAESTQSVYFDNVMLKAQEP